MGIKNQGGIVNRGGTVKITGQAIGGKANPDSKNAGEGSGGKVNDGVSGSGITVRNSVVNGKYIDHREY